MLSLLRFLAPFLRSGELCDTTRALYMGTLRILLLILHDFPDWLARFAPTLVDAVPDNCVQLINVICSAYPTSEFKSLPDPFTVELTIEAVPELARQSTAFSDLNSALQPPDLRTVLDTFLRSKTPPSFLTGLKDRVLEVSNESPDGEKALGVRYNEPLIRAIVLYSGLWAVHHMKASNTAPPVLFSPQSSPALILSRLLSDLEPEGRYVTLVAIANNLRYPSAMTGFFAHFVLHTYANTEEGGVREQIIRVLIERILVAKVCQLCFFLVFPNLR
jgi:CCR4-NOT transcription complex subunit 1